MNDLVDRIAEGTAQLLGIEEICTRLGVSRATFDRWVRNGSSGLGRKSTAAEQLISSMGPFAGSIGNENVKFPPPDIRIGNSPKWEMSTFKAWLRENLTK